MENDHRNNETGRNKCAGLTGWLTIRNDFGAPMHLMAEPWATGEYIPVGEEFHVHVSEHAWDVPMIEFTDHKTVLFYADEISMYYKGEEVRNLEDRPVPPAPLAKPIVTIPVPPPSPSLFERLFARFRKNRSEQPASRESVIDIVEMSCPIVHSRADGWLIFVNPDTLPLSLTVEPSGFICEMRQGKEFYVHLSEHEEEIPVLAYGAGGIVLHAAEAVILHNGVEIHNRASHPVMPMLCEITDKPQPHTPETDNVWLAVYDLATRLISTWLRNIQEDVRSRKVDN